MIYPISTHMIQLAQQLYSYASNKDIDFGIFGNVGSENLILGAFKILSGIQPFSNYEYIYKYIPDFNTFGVHKHESLLFLKVPEDKYFNPEKFLYPKDDLSIGLCSKHGVMTVGKVWQVYLFVTMYRAFTGTYWDEARPTLEYNDIKLLKSTVIHNDMVKLLESKGLTIENLLPQILFDSDKKICQISCHWYYRNRFKCHTIERVTYKIYPYRVKRISIEETELF